MPGSGDIISLASRARLRRLSPVPPRPEAPRKPDERPRQLARAGVTLLAIAGAMLIVGLAIGEWPTRTSLDRVPVSIRRVEYARSLEDAEQACTTFEARQGPLRQHCIDQAQFLLLFPECDAHCRGVAEDILPRVRR